MFLNADSGGEADVLIS